MTWASTIFPLLQWYSTPGKPTGEFGYSPAPGPGNLVYSNTFSAVDPYGNRTLTGAPVVYSTSLGQAMVLSSNGIQVWQGSLSTGWTLLSGNMFVFAGARQFQETTGADPNTYDTARLSQVTTGAFTVNSLSSLPIAPSSGPALAVALVPGVYEVRGIVKAQQGAAGPGQQAIGLAGTGGLVLAQSRITGTVFDTTAGVGSFLTAFELSVLGTRASVGTPALNDTFSVELDGAVNVSTAGTLQLTASCVTAAADTWTVLAMSKLVVYPVGT